jgi:hypothetical protein
MGMKLLSYYYCKTMFQVHMIFTKLLIPMGYSGEDK